MFRRFVSAIASGRVTVARMRRYAADSNAGTIDVNMSQGQATQYTPEKKDEHQEQQKGQQEGGQVQESQQRGVGSRKQRRGRNDLSFFENSWLPQLFRPPHFLDWFNASEFPFVTDQTAFSQAQISPRVDVYETDKDYMIDVEAPGMKKEDLKIRLDDDFITISGERKFEKEDKDKKNRYRRMERGYGSFQRSFEIPEGIDHSKIEANFDNGVLHISVPKPAQTEDRTGRHIEIKEVKA